jgi:hypothetical protein
VETSCGVCVVALTPVVDTEAAVAADDRRDGTRLGRELSGVPLAVLMPGRLALGTREMFLFSRAGDASGGGVRLEPA